MSRDNDWWEAQDSDEAWLKQMEEELQRYDEENSETLFANGFDEALIGVGVQFSREVAIYDYVKCVEVLMNRYEMSEEDALEYMEFNVTGAYMGTGTPVFLIRKEKYSETMQDDKQTREETKQARKETKQITEQLNFNF